MSQSTETSPKLPTDPLKLTAAAVNYLIEILPKGTAYCIGIVLVVMMTGRLVQSKGSLARAVLPKRVSSQMGMASGRKGDGARESASGQNV